jgi:hypothetical protein
MRRGRAGVAKLRPGSREPSTVGVANKGKSAPMRRDNNGEPKGKYPSYIRYFPNQRNYSLFEIHERGAVFVVFWQNHSRVLTFPSPVATFVFSIFFSTKHTAEITS